MTIDRETLAAYAEGQLDGAELARVEAAIAANPALADEVAAHRAVRERLKAHFAPVLDMPVPQRLIDAVRMPPPTAEVIVDLGAARAAKAQKAAQKPRPAFLSRWVAGGAIAASLALGLVMGSQLPGGGPIASQNGALVAQGTLDTALTTQLASADPQPVQVLLSLRNTDGRYCRVFQADAMAGLACRDNDRWAIERLQSGGAQGSAQYRQAGSPVGEIMAAAQAMAPNGALDKKQEIAARNGDWK